MDLESASQTRAKSRGRSKSCCWHCGKPGHKQKDCGALNNDVEAANAIAAMISWSLFLLFPSLSCHTLLVSRQNCNIPSSAPIGKILQEMALRCPDHAGWEVIDIT
ncbi:hypothetical protein M0R45_014692 [Rubus argutus]|uniref:CCHC-type domain-containing protein n=1 Tax=Rubus argutus TaxID=59490 RepID=A0AAW1XMZ1_RUBAR